MTVITTVIHWSLPHMIHACFKSYPSNPPWLDRSNYNQRTVKCGTIFDHKKVKKQVGSVPKLTHITWRYSTNNFKATLN
jgi:hypothetical protein